MPLPLSDRIGSCAIPRLRVQFRQPRMQRRAAGEKVSTCSRQ